MTGIRRSILWFRRDLRLHDHPALGAACADGEVVPLFVIDPAFSAAAGSGREWFLAQALGDLDVALGGTLVCRVGDPVDVVPAFAAELAVSTVHVSRDHGPYGRRRDRAVAERLAADGRHLVGTGSPYCVEPGSVRKADGTPYAVFTPFARAWSAGGPTSWRARSATGPEVSWSGRPEIGSVELPSVELPSVELPSVGPPGMVAPAVDAGGARTRWDRFVAGGLDLYDQRRDQPGVDGTSRMSAALRWGTMHPRELLDDLATTAAHDAFRNELAWRDFYADVLHHRPESAWRNLQPRMNAMPVDTDAPARARFARWCEGTTGFPIVDAGMRQLRSTGWMHNRVRMIVASFLVKDLHLPWQWGARHFLRHLIDGDLASNNHGWQWAAGTGTDAAPYFRVFNPTAQSERFDPAGTYVRRWVPELGQVDGSTIHRPVAAERGAYPAPIVDHAAERDEALRRYQVLRSTTG